MRLYGSTTRVSGALCSSSGSALVSRTYKEIGELPFSVHQAVSCEMESPLPMMRIHVRVAHGTTFKRMQMSFPHGNQAMKVSHHIENICLRPSQVKQRSKNPLPLHPAPLLPEVATTSQHLRPGQRSSQRPPGTGHSAAPSLAPASKLTMNGKATSLTICAALRYLGPK